MGHDGLDSLPVGLYALWAPAQFIATNLGEEAQTGLAEYLAAWSIKSKGQYLFEAQTATKLTQLSAHQADQSVQDHQTVEHHGTKSSLGQLGQSSFATALGHFQNLQRMYKL